MSNFSSPEINALILKAADRDEWQEVAMKVGAERDALKARMELDQTTAAEVAQNYEGELADLRAKMDRVEHEYQSALNSIAQYDKTNGALLAKLDAAELRENIWRGEREQICRKLEAVERAASVMRLALIDARALINAHVDYVHGRDVVGHIDYALLAGAGHDYVPRSEVDAAWRKGMEDAAKICDVAKASEAHSSGGTPESPA